jgi:hypothetical protein
MNNFLIFLKIIFQNLTINSRQYLTHTCADLLSDFKICFIAVANLVHAFSFLLGAGLPEEEDRLW